MLGMYIQGIEIKRIKNECSCVFKAVEKSLCTDKSSMSTISYQHYLTFSIGNIVKLITILKHNSTSEQLLPINYILKQSKSESVYI